MIKDKEIKEAVKAYILEALKGTNPDAKAELVPGFISLLEDAPAKSFREVRAPYERQPHLEAK